MKSIKRNLVYTILLNVTSVIFPLITAPYISRVLEPDGVGIFNFANTYVGYFSLFALLGIPTYGIREVAKRRDDKEALSLLVSQLISIACFCTIAVSIIFFISISVVEQLSENYLLFLIAGFGIYLAPIKINWIFQGLEEFGFITIRSLVIRTVSILCLFIFVRQKDDLLVYVILNVLGGVAADIWNFVSMRSRGIKLHPALKGLEKHMKSLLILFASTIAISLYTMIDTLMLGFISDYSEVGYYNNASHLVRMILVAIGSLSTVAVPRISYYMKNSDILKTNDLVDKSFSLMSLMLFPITIGIICMSSTFIPLFFGQKFVDAVTPLIILGFMMVPLGFNNLTGTQILIGMGLDKYFLYSMLFGAVANFCLNLFLIPSMGANGASLSSTLAETIVLLATLYFVFKYTEIKIRSLCDIYKALLGALLLIPLFFVLKIFLGGWLLVCVYAVFSAIIYYLIEYLLSNSAIRIIQDAAISLYGKVHSKKMKS